MSTLTKTRKFFSRSENQKLVIEPQDATYSGNRKIADIPGKSIQFEDHGFALTDEAAADLDMTPDEVYEWLTNHRDFNGTFWSEDAPPDQLLPSFKERSSAILIALKNEDIDALAAIRDDEKATHDRADVNLMVESALEQLAGEVDEPE